MGDRRVRVLFLEDEQAAARALGTELEKYDIEIVGIAADVDQAVLMAGARRPDVVVASIMVGDPNRRTAVRPTKQVKTLDLPRRLGVDGPPVLWYSGHGRIYALAAVLAGGIGFVSKERDTAEKLALAIRKAANGEDTWLPRDLREAREMPLPTERQLEVLIRLAKRQSNAQMAAELFLSERAIESRIRTMFGRYHLSDRFELLELADRMGWI